MKETEAASRPYEIEPEQEFIQIIISKLDQESELNNVSFEIYSILGHQTRTLKELFETCNYKALVTNYSEIPYSTEDYVSHLIKQDSANAKEVVFKKELLKVIVNAFYCITENPLYEDRAAALRAFEDAANNKESEIFAEIKKCFFKGIDEIFRKTKLTICDEIKDRSIEIDSNNVALISRFFFIYHNNGDFNPKSSGATTTLIRRKFEDKFKDPSYNLLISGVTLCAWLSWIVATNKISDIGKVFRFLGGEDFLNETTKTSLISKAFEHFLLFTYFPVQNIEQTKNLKKYAKDLRISDADLSRIWIKFKGKNLAEDFERLLRLKKYEPKQLTDFLKTVLATKTEGNWLEKGLVSMKFDDDAKKIFTENFASLLEREEEFNAAQWMNFLILARDVGLFDTEELVKAINTSDFKTDNETSFNNLKHILAAKITTINHHNVGFFSAEQVVAIKEANERKLEMVHKAAIDSLNDFISKIIEESVLTRDIIRELENCFSYNIMKEVCLLHEDEIKPTDIININDIKVSKLGFLRLIEAELKFVTSSPDDPEQIKIAASRINHALDFAKKSSNEKFFEILNLLKSEAANYHQRTREILDLQDSFTKIFVENFARAESFISRENNKVTQFVKKSFSVARSMGLVSSHEAIYEFLKPIILDRTTPLNVLHVKTLINECNSTQQKELQALFSTRETEHKHLCNLACKKPKTLSDFDRAFDLELFTYKLHGDGKLRKVATEDEAEVMNVKGVPIRRLDVAKALEDDAASQARISKRKSIFERIEAISTARKQQIEAEEARARKAAQAAVRRQEEDRVVKSFADRLEVDVTLGDLKDFSFEKLVQPKNKSC